MYVLYTIIFILSGIVALPYLLWRSLRGAMYHRDWPERLGYITVPPTMTGGVWFHAASVGEVQGLQPIIAAFHRHFPTLPILLSTFTPTGKATATRVVPEAAKVFVLPLDLPWIMQQVMRRVQPRILIVQETELWPNLFRAAARQQVPLVVVNGRLSPRAFRRYHWLRFFMRQVLAQVTMFLVQSETIAERLVRLGAPPERLQVIGNTNIDRALQLAEEACEAHPLAKLMAGKRVLIGGSTHAGEETVLLSVYQRLCTQYADLLLILAPRHLERVASVMRQIRALPCRVIRRSQCDNLSPQDLAGPCVIVLDTLGELAALYQVGTIAFVGGSLVPVGGHNILEPAVFARPVMFGPYMHHFPELAALLCDAGGAIQVRNEAELYAQMQQILAQPQVGEFVGQRARRVLAANRGALARTQQALTTVIEARDGDHLYG